MSRASWITFALVVLIVAGVVALAMHLRSERPAPTELDGPSAPSAQSDERGVFEGSLYFPGAGGRLFTERRELPDGTTQELVGAMIEALLAGPASGSTLRAPLPEGTSVGSVFAMDDLVYLDLRTPEGEPPPSFGSKRELLAVYSLVDTVALNVDGVEGVVLMWNGRQQPTFAGHVDTTRPLRPVPELIVER
ncbi:MAG: GerMN domain-containing protein [Acidobacteriota bacterium]